ncbi:dihydrofolate reductase family protein [Bosea sp. 2YAB26]|uniref:dihydrofolate reductase family protein n=1 Tax=unclassified Bosea (in: a-proteobacteria) TaxID=2653178 RepID=UPI003F93517A
MRNVVAATFLSLDGVMQAPGGPEEDSSGGFSHGGWTFHYWDEPMGEVMEKAFAEEFDLLLGRKTYDIFAAHWPHAGDDPVAMKFNACIKYVATSAPKTLNWQNSVALRGDIAAEVAALKRQDGPKLLLQGSSELIQLLLAKDLIDEFNLLIFPVVLGAGKRLFGEGTMPAAFTLVESRVSSTGVIMATYRRAGAVTTGSFALEAPSEDEIARREKNLSAA